MQMNQGKVGGLPGSLRAFVQVSLDKTPNSIRFGRYTVCAKCESSILSRPRTKLLGIVVGNPKTVSINSILEMVDNSLPCDVHN